VYAAFCTPYKDNASELSFRQNLVERRDIALYLKNKYGERLTVDEVTTEMDNAISGTGEWLRDIVLYLKNKYGERLTADKVTTEMDNAINGTGAWLPINGKPQGDES
jgi:NADPH-dependent glutamate synthase beta subunit-like oxidoreductase